MPHQHFLQFVIAIFFNGIGTVDDIVDLIADDFQFCGLGRRGIGRAVAFDHQTDTAVIVFFTDLGSRSGRIGRRVAAGILGLIDQCIGMMCGLNGVVRPRLDVLGLEQGFGVIHVEIAESRAEMRGVFRRGFFAERFHVDLHRKGALSVRAGFHGHDAVVRFVEETGAAARARQVALEVKRHLAVERGRQLIRLISGIVESTLDDEVRHGLVALVRRFEIDLGRIVRGDGIRRDRALRGSYDQAVDVRRKLVVEAGLRAVTVIVFLESQFDLVLAFHEIDVREIDVLPQTPQRRIGIAVLFAAALQNDRIRNGILHAVDIEIAQLVELAIAHPNRRPVAVLFQVLRGKAEGNVARAGGIGCELEHHGHVFGILGIIGLEVTDIQAAVVNIADICLRIFLHSK